MGGAEAGVLMARELRTGGVVEAIQERSFLPGPSFGWTGQDRRCVLGTLRRVGAVDDLDAIVTWVRREPVAEHLGEETTAADASAGSAVSVVPVQVRRTLVVVAALMASIGSLSLAVVVGPGGGRTAGHGKQRGNHVKVGGVRTGLAGIRPAGRGDTRALHDGEREN